MLSATSDSAQSSHATQQGRTWSSEESFALLVEPFDSVEGELILALNPSLSIMTWVQPHLVWDAASGVHADHAISTLSIYSSYPYPFNNTLMFFLKRNLKSFALINQFTDDMVSPASRAYPKVLDITSPTGSPTNKKVDTTGAGGNDKNSHRPWPKPDEHQNGSKRKREEIKPDLPKLPGHQQDNGPLQRWLHEPQADGPYHGISDAAEAPCQARSTKCNNTKKH